MEFREALQDVPRSRSGALSKMAFPELAQWGRGHPDDKKISATTVNKQFGGVQAIVNWARDTGGMIPDDLWADPFAKLRLDEDDPEGGPFEHDQLRTLFGSPVFTAGERPEAGRGDVAFWLPLLGLFTGARRGELAVLTASDVQKDEATGQWAIAVRKDTARGKRLKTNSSARTVPVHPELVRMGFLDYVKSVDRKDKEAWLFAAVSTKESVKAWSKWFRRHLDRLGITDSRKGLHSLRHNFTDALREAGAHDGLIDALTGHTVRTVGRSYGARATHAAQRHKVNVRRFGMAQLADAVGKVNYPMVDLNRAPVGARARAGYHRLRTHPRGGEHDDH